MFSSKERKSKYTFRNDKGKVVYEALVSPAFLHVLFDFEIASARHNDGLPLPLHFDTLEAFYELTSSKVQPTEFGGAKSTLLGDPETGTISVGIFAAFGQMQEALIAHEVGHMYLLVIGYPSVFAPEGVTKLASGITNMGSHWPLYHYLQSCGIDVDSDSELRVQNMATYLPRIDFDSAVVVRLSLDFVDTLRFVPEQMRDKFEQVVKEKSPHFYELMEELKPIVDSIPPQRRVTPRGAEETMRRLCDYFPETKSYVVKKDFFSSLLPKKRKEPSI